MTAASPPGGSLPVRMLLADQAAPLPFDPAEERHEVHLASWYDEEDEQTHQMLCTDYDDALDQVDGDEDQVHTTVRPLATRQLLTTCGWDTTQPAGAFELLVPCWTEAETDLDGVWWHDEPRVWSAPRGVILPDRLGQWDPTQVR